MVTWSPAQCLSGTHIPAASCHWRSRYCPLAVTEVHGLPKFPREGELQDSLLKEFRKVMVYLQSMSYLIPSKKSGAAHRI